jgi:hypothetical protein
LLSFRQMKQILLTLLAASFSIAALAQIPKTLTVKGIVTDSATNQPISYVTVALQLAKGQIAVKSVLTKEDGSFELSAPSGKSYQIAVANLGHQAKVVAIADTAGVINLGKIVMGTATRQLAGVTVTAVKPLMKREVDRISYNVQSDPESKSVSALDMMRKVPLLSVDANDAIKLKGNSNYRILVNGHESVTMVTNPSDILKAMPAVDIDRIEVITTPPAKYDAEGLAGIINIVTKKKVDEGYSINLNGRENTLFGAGINTNVTIKQGKFGIVIGGGLSNRGNKNKAAASGDVQNFFAQQSLLTQTGTRTQSGYFNYGNADISYEIDSLNLLTASIENFGRKIDVLNNRSSVLTNSQGVVSQSYFLSNPGTDKGQGLGANINYQLGFAKQKDRLLTLSYRYDYSPGNQFFDNQFTNRVNYTTALHPDYQQFNSSGNKTHTAQLDYAHPFKNITIEAGAKGIFRDNFSDYHLDNKDYATNTYVTNPAQTNNFNYHQNVASLYNSYQLKWNTWAIKGGLRLEHTGIDADFATIGATVKQDYNNFIPSISLLHSFKSSSLNFGFTQRIQRPGIFQLNPFVDRSNPKFIRTGNPDLRPELNNTFELNYSNYTHSPISIGLSYAFSNNSIQNVTGLQINTVGRQVDTVTITTFQNLGSNNILTFSINTSLAITKNFNIEMNGQVNHVWLKGQYGGQLYKNDGFTGQLQGFASYKLGKGYRFGADLGYYSGNVVLQGSNSSYIYLSHLISKEFLNRTATISLVVNNPYSNFINQTNTVSASDFYQSGYTKNYYRSFAVRFNYRFGRLNSQIKKNKHGINNDDTKAGGDSNTGN